MRKTAIGCSGATRLMALALLFACGISFAGAGARAEERRFAVTLAHSPKSQPDLPPGQLTNPEIINKDYFDTIDPNIESFAEYWKEISYGDITISGQTFGWVMLPWRYVPGDASPASPINLNRSLMGGCNQPFSTGDFHYGAGEEFCDCFADGNDATVITPDSCGALIIRDLVGGRQNASPPVRGPGLDDRAATGAGLCQEGTCAGGLTPGRFCGGDADCGVGVWTPGERFIDLDGDNRWDGIDEKNDMMCHGAIGCVNVCSLFVCSEGMGVCSANQDCPGNGLCLNGRCQISCSEDVPNSCPNGGVCRAGRCRAPCQNNDDCPDGEGCISIGSDRPCAGDQTLPCPDNEFCMTPELAMGDYFPSGPRGCAFPGCGDLQMPGVDWTADNELENCGDACVRHEYVICERNADCDSDQCVFSLLPDHETLGYCLPTVCVPPNEDDGCNIQLPPCCEDPNDPEPDCIPENMANPGVNCTNQEVANPRICCEFHDVDENNAVNVVEPFEDFMIRWDPSGTSPINTWVRVTDEYIRNNYPGDVKAVIVRSHNRYYDSPDVFLNVGNTKMQQDAGLNRHTYSTPKPGARYSGSPNFEQAWFEPVWASRYTKPDGTPSTAPPWPGGDGPSPFLNSPRMIEFDPENPTALGARIEIDDEEANRRWFRPTRGGWDGRGSGTADNPNRLLALGTNTTEESILPEEVFGYYDGWVEHDDLASSIYHRAGDKRLGEVTSPFFDTISSLPLGVLDEPIPAIFGVDMGQNHPNSPGVLDNFVVAAGPGAVNVHGQGGFDAGDVLITEWLTWRTDGQSPTISADWAFENHFDHPFATPFSARPVGFRDYNLDGMIDQGSVRPLFSENYSVDSNPATVNDGTDTNYPFNRRRMMEDIVAALDASVDWRLFRNRLPRLPDIDTVSGIILLPPDAYADRELFPLAPSFYPIFTMDQQGPLYFHDLPICQNCRDFPSAIRYAAHEYLHTWEDLPDLYDYDFFDVDQGAIVNCPMGAYDIMTNVSDLVHPTPILKEQTGWLEPVDLASLLTPGVPSVITMPPFELVREESAYFLENPERPGERYWFWSAGSGFGERLPSDGMLIMHTDVGANPFALPLQQRQAPWTYYIVQADGLRQLEACSTGGNIGDPGDFWPGSEDVTEFGFDTTPASTWWELNNWTGLQVTSVEPDGRGSVAMTLSWTPTEVPAISFLSPPGGESVNNRYQIRFVANDLFGGTSFELFFTEDENDLSMRRTDPNRNLIATVSKTAPGRTQESGVWDLLDPPVDNGRYFIFAKIVPGTGQSGVERVHSQPRAGRNNQGDGNMQVIEVNLQDAPTHLGKGACCLPFNEDPQCFNNVAVHDCLNNFLGAYKGDGTTCAEVTCGCAPGCDWCWQDTIFENNCPIEWNGDRECDCGCQFCDVDCGPCPAGSDDTTTARSEVWTAVFVSQCDGGDRDNRPCTQAAECPGGACVQDWKVNSSLTQPEPDDPNEDPFPHAQTCPRNDPNDCADFVYTSVNNAVRFVIREGDTPFEAGDRFSFVTTGISALSQPVVVLNNRISGNPRAAINASPLSGPSPMTVTFDASASVDPEGLPMTFSWNFGDGSPEINTESVPVVQHTYQNFGTFTATVRATNSQGRIGEAQVDIVVINNQPIARFTANPTSGPRPLIVTFDASASSDVETPNNRLIFQWNFGDSNSRNSAGLREDQLPPNSRAQNVQHEYRNRVSGFSDTLGRQCTPANPCPCVSDDICTFTVTLTVTDEGGRSAQATTQIVVGNNPPVLGEIDVTPIDGAAPLTVSFDASSVIDPDGDTVTADWDFGDGNTLNNASLVIPHTYANPGTYTPSAVFRDGQGGNVPWTGPSIGVVAPGPAPVATFSISPAQPEIDQAFLVDATDSVGNIVSYVWNWGDGSDNGSGVQATHTYTAEGTFTIRLTITTLSGAMATATRTVTIEIPPVPPNRPPVAIIATGPRTASAPASLTFDGRASWDPDGDPLQFSWEFELNDEVVDTLTGPVVTRIFDIVGSYMVRLTVSDGQGGVSTVEIPEPVQITAPVTPPPPPPPPEPPPAQEIPDSAGQRPTAGRLCGFGMIMPMFATLGLLGLVRWTRRRI